MVGDEVNQLTVIRARDITCPKKNGIVQDWEGMKLLWEYTFNEKMKIDPKQCKVLISEPPMNPMKNREKMVEVHNKYYTKRLDIIGYIYSYYLRSLK